VRMLGIDGAADAAPRVGLAIAAARAGRARGRDARATATRRWDETTERRARGRSDEW